MNSPGIPVTKRVCVGNVFQMTEPASSLLDDDALELENEEEREKDEIWGEQ